MTTTTFHSRAAGTDITLHSLPAAILQGSEIPCPALFAKVCNRFSPLVNLDLIDTAAFRPYALLWAATGSPTIDPELQGISICLIIYKTVQFINEHLLQIAVTSDTDPFYADSQHRNIMLAEDNWRP